MTSPTSLSEAWEARREEAALSAHAVQKAPSRRDFMAGALAALELLAQGRERLDLFAEVAQYGRSVGTAAEAA